MIRFSVTENGIRVKKSLISAVEIPVEEIRKIHIASGDSSVTTKDGTEYVSKSVGVLTHSYPQIYDYIVKHNIDFTDDYEKTGVGKVYTHDEVLEMVSRTTTVAQEAADRVIREKLGIPFEDTYAFGDSTNDMTMFEHVKHSIAMGNAPDDVKAACTWVTARPEEDGIKKAMIRFGIIADE